MTENELKQLKLLIVATSAYYGKTVPDPVLAMYIEDLADLPFDRIVVAVRDLRRDPKSTGFPLPAKLRELVSPQDRPEDDAREAASRIIAAVARYGWCNAERARDYIGALGWQVVQQQGGWPTVCRMIDDGNMGVMQAQFRQLAEVVIRRAKQGKLEQPPGLPDPNGPASPRKVLSLLKSMPGGS